MFTPRVSLHKPQAPKAFRPRKGQYPFGEELKDLRRLGGLNAQLRSPKLAQKISRRIANMGGGHPQRRVSERLAALYLFAARAGIGR